MSDKTGPNIKSGGEGVKVHHNMTKEQLAERLREIDAELLDAATVREIGRLEHCALRLALVHLSEAITILTAPKEVRS
jgi:hypothetical protein